jgi:UDP-glucose:(heptosyl)LPS alpha-1,3-glucosyltransferase
MTGKKKKLKIAILIRNFVTTGGAERYAMEVTRRLAKDHEVHVFAQEWTYYGNEKIYFHRIPKYFERPSFINQLIFSYFTGRALDSSFDIIHAHERVTRFDALTIHCPCFKNLLTESKSHWKRLLTRISIAFSFRKMAWLWLEKKQFQYKDNRLLIAVSENVKRNVQINYPLPDEFFRLAYPAVDMAFHSKSVDIVQRERSRIGLREDDLVILFVGTEFKRKGLDALLHGFAKIWKPGIRLLVAGAGEQKKYLKVAKDLGIENDVIFLGLVKDIELIYSLSDIYILPTISDPSPLAPIEAMASGLATIMSCQKYAGSAEHVKNNEAIILNDPKDHEEIAQAIKRLLDKAKRLELGEKGLQLAKKITWEKTTADTLSAYYTILELKSETSTG